MSTTGNHKPSEAILAPNGLSHKSSRWVTGGLVPERGPRRTLALASFVNQVGSAVFMVSAALFFTRPGWASARWSACSPGSRSGGSPTGAARVRSTC